MLRNSNVVQGVLLPDGLQFLKREEEEGNDII